MPTNRSKETIKNRRKKAKSVHFVNFVVAMRAPKQSEFAQQCKAMGENCEIVPRRNTACFQQL